MQKVKRYSYKNDYHEIKINNLPRSCSDLFTYIHFQRNKKVLGPYATDASALNVECVNFDGYGTISTEKKLHLSMSRNE